MVNVLQPQSGDILLNSTGTGTIGRSALFEGDGGQFIIDGHVTVVRPISEIAHGHWLNELLASPWGQTYLETYCYAGSTNQIELSANRLSRLSIGTPSPVEQRRIAEILATIDKQIRKTKQTIIKLKLIHEGLVRDLLLRGIDGSGNVRDPLARPEQFCDTRLGVIPIGWSIFSVEAQFEIRAGITLGPHRRPKENSSGYLRVANVQRSRIDVADVAQIAASPAEQSEYALRVDDLLVVEGHADVRQIGRCARVDANSAGLLYQNHLFRLRPHSIDPVFAELWLNSDYARGYWRAMCGTSSGLNTINSKQLKSMLVAVPSSAEQARIRAVALATRGRVSHQEAELAKLLELKQGVMADLLTGRVRVPVETAS